MDAARIQKVSLSRQVIGLLLAVPFGLGGFALVFSDLAPWESDLGRSLMLAVWYLGAGAVVGAVTGSRRWWIATACAWASVGVAIIAPTRTPNSILQLALIPIALSGLGGFFGARVWERRARTASGSPRGPASPGA